MKIAFSILLGIFLFCSVQGQEATTEGKSDLEIAIGFNPAGPARKMYRLMEEYNFNDPGSSWFSGKTYETPIMSPSFNSRLSYFRIVKPGIKAGVIINYSYLKEISGLDNDVAYLRVFFSNITAVLPAVKFDLKKSWEFLTGPAAMINIGIGSGGYGPDDKYIKPSFGVLTGLNLKVWDRPGTFGNLTINYLLAAPNRMGPFTAVNISGDRSNAIPESSFNFGHVNAGLILGFHLAKNK